MPHRMRSFLALVLLLVFGTFLVSCDENGGDGVLTIDGVGAVTGLVFRDLDRNRSFSDGDKRLGDTTIRLQPWGANSTIAVTQTDDSGVFRFPRVPVGTYRVVVDPAVTGDSLVVARRGDDEVTILEGSTLTSDLPLVRP